MLYRPTAAAPAIGRRIQIDAPEIVASRWLIINPAARWYKHLHYNGQSTHCGRRASCAAGRCRITCRMLTSSDTASPQSPSQQDTGAERHLEQRRVGQPGWIFHLLKAWNMLLGASA